MLMYNFGLIWTQAIVSSPLLDRIQKSARKFLEVCCMLDFKMASAPVSSDGNIVGSSLCTSCLQLTNYSCISCPTVICNKCSVLESDEETEGWVARKSVGYCRFCFEEKQTTSEEPRSPTPLPTSRKRYLHVLPLNFLFLILIDGSSSPYILWAVSTEFKVNRANCDTIMKVGAIG